MCLSMLTLAIILTMNFQGQIFDLLYLRNKWTDGNEMKNAHINWMQDLKCIICDFDYDIDLF